MSRIELGLRTNFNNRVYNQCRQPIIPHICQFQYTAALLRSIKSTPKNSVNSRQNSQNWSKFAKFGQHFAFSMLKSTPARKKYTTAGCGGCDKYELCIQKQTLQYLLFSSYFDAYIRLACGLIFLCAENFRQKFYLNQVLLMLNYQINTKC